MKIRHKIKMNFMQSDGNVLQQYTGYVEMLQLMQFDSNVLQQYAGYMEIIASHTLIGRPSPLVIDEDRC